MSIESRKYQYGTVFGHWQIKEIIGRGSDGKSAVFRLEHTVSPGVFSALKVISLIEEQGKIEELSPLRKDDYVTARERCYRQAEQEVLLMDTLQGRTNIVDYLDHSYVDWSDESGFGRDMLIRMELLRDLRRGIREGRAFSEKEALKVGRDICNALILCHGKNIIHRDIKPENIFVNSSGDYKLGDFGISKITVNSSSRASTGIGTPQYEAPEQLSNSYDRRVDIYSLGLVLYELMNGNLLPFASSVYVTQEEINLRLAGTPLPRPKNASDAFSQLILKACANDPNARFQSAEAMAEAISDLLPSDSSGSYATVPASKEPPDTAYPTKPAAADNRDIYQTQPATKTNISTPAPKPPRRWLLIAVSVCTSIVLLGILAFFTVHKWTPATCTEPKTCVICGKTSGEVLGHRWMPATCTEPETCKRCGETNGSALGHSWAQATCTEPETCKRCGETNGSALGHSWAPATCTEPGICTVCGEISSGALGHDWLPATCTEPETCKRCGETNGEALGHSWVDATYTAPKTCSRCGITEGNRKYYSDRYSVGDSFFYGSYEQDNNSANGPEPIEWIVLGKKEDSVLVISKYALHCLPFNKAFKDITWENSTIRSWLNGDFLYSAFTETERKSILSVTLSTNDNPVYGIDSGNDTQDRVFLLSHDEVEEYMKSTEFRICRPTKYTVEQGYILKPENQGDWKECWWWLRTAGEQTTSATFVDEYGTIRYGGNWVSDAGGLGERPAMWLDLSIVSDNS